MENKLQQLLEEAHALVKRVSVNEIISSHDDYCIIDVRELAGLALTTAEKPHSPLENCSGTWVSDIRRCFEDLCCEESI